MMEDVIVTGHDATRQTFTVERGAALLTEQIVRAALHHRGEFQIGPHIKIWCVCGFRWEGESRKAAEEAWDAHLAP